jgi:TolA-binding protein
MKRLFDEPARLSDLRPEEDPEHLGRMVRSAAAVRMDDVPRLKSRLRYSMGRRSTWRRPLGAIFLGGVLLLTGVVMGAVAQPILHLWERWRAEPAVKPDASAPAAPSRHRGVSTPPSRASAAARLSPAAPAAPASSPPEVEPPPPVPGDSSAVRAPSPTLQPSPRAEPVLYQLKPLAMRPTSAPASRGGPRSSAGWAASPALPGAAPPRETLRVATLDPPSMPAAGGPLTTGSLSGGPAPPVAQALPSQPRADVPLPDKARIISEHPALPAAAPPAVPPAPVVAPAPVVGPVPSEQSLLAMAVRRLRSEQRPASALAVLDQYVARFPNGSLLPEAIRLRTEALLALGDKPAALAELNRELAPVGSSDEESRLVRGELRAAAGRWHEALEDFDVAVRAHRVAVDPAASTKLHERLQRALWGRASARSHLGDLAGARADLLEYLRRFPQGRFAGRAARLLGQLH